MRYLRIRLIAGLVLGATLVFIAAWPVAAQFFGGQEIASAGPLTRILVSDTLGCQVAHRDDEQFEFYPSGSELGNCGTFIGLGGNVYGPAGGAATTIPWTAVSQTQAAGAGTVADPLIVITTVEIPEARLRIQQMDQYVVGNESYRTDVAVSNVGNAIQTGVLFRGGDCYLQGNDSGLVRVDKGAPACIVDPAVGRRIQQWVPLTPDSHYYAGYYGNVWSLMGLQQNFPDECECDSTTTFDNGAGLSWTLNVAPGMTQAFAHETFFSPLGRTAVEESFTSSVPDPTQISLDPVVIATSVAVAAGVIILVPFPSALFNSTLEENYDEVMAWLARLRAWLASQSAAVRARIRRWWEERKARRAAAAAAPATASMPSTASAAPPPPAAPSAERTPPVAPPQPEAPPPPDPAPPPSADLYAPLTAKPERDVWRTPLGMLGFVALSALLYSFLDPTFGFSLTSVATFLGLAIGLLIVLLAYGLPLLFFSRARGLSLSVRALPATLLIGVVCVLISRLVSFQPGYLYGLIIGFFFAHTVARDLEGKAEAMAAGASLIAAFVAWVALAFLRGTPAGEADAFFNSLLQAASVTIVVAGLENAVFAMLPLRFMPGAAVYGWNRIVWVVLIGLGIFGFAHVLLNPSAGYLADTTRTSFFTLVVLLVAFGLASVAFWAYFRFRPTRAEAPTST